MEKAVSERAPDEKLAEFERGDAIEVQPERIEAELAQLWRRAAESKPGDAPKPVTRACLWNLIVRVEGEPQFTHIKRVIDDLSQRIPARAIVTRVEDGPDSLRAFVEANWRRREGGMASGSDEVTLWATGAAKARLPSLVRALLFSDAPTAIFFPGALAPFGGHTREYVHEADRLIVDSRKLTSERGSSTCARTGRTIPSWSCRICPGWASRRCGAWRRRCSTRRAILACSSSSIACA